MVQGHPSDGFPTACPEFGNQKEEYPSPLIFVYYDTVELIIVSKHDKLTQCTAAIVQRQTVARLFKKYSAFCTTQGFLNVFKEKDIESG